jgi:uncharacterized protein YoxC
LAENQGTIIGNQAALTTGQQNISNQIAAIPQTSVTTQVVDTSGIENRIGTLEGTTQSGFDTMGGRFDTVDASLAGISQDTAGLGTKVDDLGTTVDTGFEDVNAGIAGLDASMGAAQEDRDVLKESVLSGQTTMTDLINQYGQAGALYYEQLAQGQAQMIEQQAGIQTGLTEFRDDFGDYSGQMASAVGDLGDQVVGGFDAVRSGQNNLSSAVSGVKDTVQNTAQAATSVVGAQQQQSAPVEIDYARIAKEVAVGTNTQSTEAYSNGAMFAEKLDSIRNMISTQGGQMDARMRDQYTKLASSFDDQGRLLTSQIDSNGNQVARAIDQQGNLLMAAFDQSGQRIMQDSLNINRMMAMFDQTMRYRAGSNYNMGRLSPARRGRNGMMSPYTMTFDQ